MHCSVAGKHITGKKNKKTAVEMLVLRHYDVISTSKWNKVIEYVDVVHINVVVADKFDFCDRVLRLDPGLFHSECLAKILPSKWSPSLSIP